ncbi:unnamed protein product [Knipowitschia caucasica]|uniref:Origin recognition complex subunit 1 n=1 Tax=Knipowitschia caucasica TaxID=637954 RepID=A0AAV2KWS0_KNICA
MKYSTRLRARRLCEWSGKPVAFDRKLKTHQYGGLSIRVEGLPRVTHVSVGQHILIEGDDEDHPYVAKVLQLLESSGEKKALVQWFVRVFEIPLNKRKLLGREPHPNEVFHYEGANCDNEVSAESILRTVTVVHVEGSAPFPASSDSDTFFVKLSWDSRRFSVWSECEARAPSPLAASLPSGPSPSSPGHAPSSPGPSSSLRRTPRCRPTPDFNVMKRASSSSYAEETRLAQEAESLHSASKASASKSLSAKRRKCSVKTPGVRKRLQLFDDSPLDSDLDLLLAEDLKTVEIQTLSPQKPRISLTPLRRSASYSQSEEEDRPSDRAMTPSRKREAKSLKGPMLGVLAEVDHENSPLDRVTPRSSKRKSAQVVSKRIQRQLSMLSGRLDMDTDSEEEFVPSKQDQSSSSEEEEEEEEDEEEVGKRRPRGAARTPRKTPQKTPRKTPRKISLGSPRTPRQYTPSIPSRCEPARRPGTNLEEARARLHVSSVPESLPCREQEFQDIYSFVESKILDGTGGCMYISGVPGTGKTATVQEVVRCLQTSSENGEIPSFTFLEINGMKMTDPHQAYVQILQKLTGQKATPDHAASLLEKRFSSPAPRKETTVLLVDELDLLWTRKQNVMYNLFDWPTRRHARLVVLTIANTMDLPERIMINRVASRLGLTRMSFQPYSFKQLQQIISSRLNRIKAFEEDALQLVSRKVAALSGDARRCLDICRRSTEICEHSVGGAKEGGARARLVEIGHVMEALSEMFSSAYVSAIKSASVQEQIFLRAVIAEFRRLGLEEATFQQVYVQQVALCRVEGVAPVCVSEGLSVCGRLGALRLLLLEQSHNDLLLRIRLNVSQDDVLFALKAE